MENKTVILSDLDGTLFHNDKSISAFTKEVIAWAQSKGILFGISTSRALVNASKFLDGLSPDIMITNGGGLAFYKGKKIYSSTFSASETRTLIDEAFRLCGKDFTISVDNETGLFSNSKEELGDKFWTYTDFDDFSEPAMKICLKTLDKTIVEKILLSIGIENADYLPFSDIPWYKISKKDATKEKAIEALCSSINIRPENIVAFGDDCNDIGMLKMCGKSVAMENAIPEVKAFADEICLSNENDGVAKWIQRRFAC